MGSPVNGVVGSQARVPTSDRGTVGDEADSKHSPYSLSPLRTHSCGRVRPHRASAQVCGLFKFQR